MAGILAWFWNERFWLPHNVTWADLKSTEEATFPQAEDLYLGFPVAFCIFMIRMLFERFIAKPCALGLKVQANGPQKAQPNAILEKVFTAITKHPDEKRLEGLSKQLDWDVRSIQRWFRQRRNQEKPSTLRRFCESMWRFTFYLYIFTYGVRQLNQCSWLCHPGHRGPMNFPESLIKTLEHSVFYSFFPHAFSNHPGWIPFEKTWRNDETTERQPVESQEVRRKTTAVQNARRHLHGKTPMSPCLWNTRQCWIGYPLQPLTPELHYYYIVEISFYWSLMFSQFIDIKRKDFAIMFTHHILAVMLLTLSYTVNFLRVGALTMCLHDLVDVVLEAAKLTNYCKCQRLCDVLFLLFAIIFIITRLGMFPLWILNTAVFELPEITGSFPGLTVFIILLLILQVLHCFWSYLIVKAAYKAISKGKARDDRSDVESSSDEETSPPHSKISHSSATTNGTSGANGTNGYLTGGDSAEEH